MEQFFFLSFAFVEDCFNMLRILVKLLFRFLVFVQGRSDIEFLREDCFRSVLAESGC